ncbi:MAG: hypothetical protein FD143_75 [Ignavibacteria bacterium]|nr:MAG: hypothetical protein FD143_75 [Ignavibacteria bacterium]KAF0162510.1 MAG: hypothetical protein FD188_113 [Ignavibacteria bacterium]
MKKIKRLGRQNTTTVRNHFLDSSIYGIQVKAFLQLIGYILICFIFISTLVFLFPAKTSKHNHIETKSSKPAIEENVVKIASMFICSCQKCKMESLEVCKCNRAIEERNLIRKCTEQEETVNNIVLTIAERYGFLKAEYANNYNVDKSQIWSNSN